MARLRLVGRSGFHYQLNKKETQFDGSSHGNIVEKTDTPQLQHFAHIQRGLKLFCEIAGHSDEVRNFAAGLLNWPM